MIRRRHRLRGLLFTTSEFPSRRKPTLSRRSIEGFASGVSPKLSHAWIATFSRFDGPAEEAFLTVGIEILEWTRPAAAPQGSRAGSLALMLGGPALHILSERRIKG